MPPIKCSPWPLTISCTLSWRNCSLHAAISLHFLSYPCLQFVKGMQPGSKHIFQASPEKIIRSWKIWRPRRCKKYVHCQRIKALTLPAVANLSSQLKVSFTKEHKRLPTLNHLHLLTYILLPRHVHKIFLLFNLTKSHLPPPVPLLPPELKETEFLPKRFLISPSLSPLFNFSSCSACLCATCSLVGYSL